MHGYLAFFIPWLAYLYGLAPTVTVGDSGELITGAATLSLPHAPSYPLFCLLARALGEAIPLGNWAYRVNLFSSLCMAAGGHLLWRWGRRMGFSSSAALFGALALVLLPGFARQASVTEVFSLHLCLASLLAVTAWGNGLRSVRLFSFLFALGMGNHHTLVLVLPALFWRFRKRIGGALPSSLLLFLLGLSITLYLPLRSSQGPPLNWGEPTNRERFLRSLTRKDYGTFSLTVEGSGSRGFSSLRRQSLRFFGNIRKEMGLPLFVLSLLGWVLWWRRGSDREGWFCCLVWTLAAGPGFLCLGNPPFDPETEGALARFYLLPLLPWAFSLSAVWEAFSRRLGRGSGILWFFLLGTLLCSGLAGRARETRRDTLSEDYGRNILRSLPPGAALFMDGGDDTFYSLATLRFVRSLREDLALHDRGGLVFPNPYGKDFRKLSRPEKELRRQEVEKGFLRLRPLYYSTMNPEILPGHPLRWFGLVQPGPLGQPADSTSGRPGGQSRAKSRGSPRGVRGPLGQPAESRSLESWESHGLWPFYVRRGFEDGPPSDYRDRALACYFPFMKGLFWRSRTRPDLAGRHYLWAETWGKDVRWLKSNLSLEYHRMGHDFFQGGDWVQAETFYRAALRIDPEAAEVWMNLGVVSEKQGRGKEAESFYRKAVEIRPELSQAAYNLGSLYWSRQDWKRAAEAFEEVLRREPQNASARRFLHQARLRGGG